MEVLKTNYGTKHAYRYDDQDFDALSKVWASLGLELLIHKEEVDPMIDIIERTDDGFILSAQTICVGQWFVHDISNGSWGIYGDSFMQDALGKRR